ncbi:MAG: ATP-binding protein [Acidobacteria bacterium]|nr:ATP-binding protein [Acidobacteriota bacterium]
MTESIKQALAESPVVLLIGARQSGKSTLVRNLGPEDHQPLYLTFDDLTLLSSASANPQAFLDSVQKPVIFDEIQRIPDLLIHIKKSVDEDRKPGSYLLTGSANVLALPMAADSLVGRMDVIKLFPLSQGEINGQKESFIDMVCSDNFALPGKTDKEDREHFFDRIFTGGFPEAVQRTSKAGRDRWFRAYTTTLLQRDMRDLANIEGAADLPRLLSVLAARSGGLVNFADISRSTAITQTTLKRYIALLEQLFLIDFLPAYSANLTKRLTKAPKLYFSDTGILSYLIGANWQKMLVENTMAGTLVENFVVNELKKQAGWNETNVTMYHFRTTNNEEVDIILEMPGGDVVGIEVKSGASIGKDAFKGLKVLKENLGKKFKRGIVLYTGEISTAFDNDMFALPIQTMWAEQN